MAFRLDMRNRRKCTTVNNGGGLENRHPKVR